MKKLRSKRAKLAFVGGLLTYNVYTAVPSEAWAKPGVQPRRATVTLESLMESAELARAQGDAGLYRRLLRLVSSLLDNAPQGVLVAGKGGGKGGGGSVRRGGKGSGTTVKRSGGKGSAGGGKGSYRSGGKGSTGGGKGLFKSFGGKGLLKRIFGGGKGRK